MICSMASGGPGAQPQGQYDQGEPAFGTSMSWLLFLFSTLTLASTGTEGVLEKVMIIVVC